MKNNKQITIADPEDRILEIGTQINKLNERRQQLEYIMYLIELEKDNVTYGEFRPSGSCKMTMKMNNFTFHEVRKLLIELYELELNE